MARSLVVNAIVGSATATDTTVSENTATVSLGERTRAVPVVGHDTADHGAHGDHSVHGANDGVHGGSVGDRARGNPAGDSKKASAPMPHQPSATTRSTTARTATTAHGAPATVCVV